MCAWKSSIGGVRIGCVRTWIGLRPDWMAERVGEQNLNCGRTYEQQRSAPAVVSTGGGQHQRRWRKHWKLRQPRVLGSHARRSCGRAPFQTGPACPCWGCGRFHRHHPRTRRASRCRTSQSLRSGWPTAALSSAGWAAAERRGTSETRAGGAPSARMART